MSPERRLSLTALARRLGHKFKDLSLLDQALRHSSHAHERPEEGPSNEPLEFLGDAVLALTVSNLLWTSFPLSSEGELSRRRAALVKSRRLAALARGLDLGTHLLLGRGEERQGGRKKASLLADALEAVLAAVFLDGGLKAAQTLTERWFAPILSQTADLGWQDPKTALQELAQSRYKLPPAYPLAALKRALSLARPEGYIRTFVDEGEPMVRLLHIARSQKIETEYVSALLSVFEKTTGPTQLPPKLLTEPLTAREVGVLNLIKAGCSNQDIADQLVISMPTVKRHISNV